jgi:hypothetical protein
MGLFGNRKLGTVTVEVPSAGEPVISFGWQEPLSGPTDDQLIALELLLLGRLVSNLGNSWQAQRLIEFAHAAYLCYHLRPDLDPAPGTRPNSGTRRARDLHRGRDGQPFIQASFGIVGASNTGLAAFHALLRYLKDELSHKNGQTLFAALKAMAAYYEGGGRRGIGSELQALAFAIQHTDEAREAITSALPQKRRRATAKSGGKKGR